MHDVVIVGGGPAGLTAGIYARRAKLDAVLVEKGMPGGQAATTHWVENYPGFVKGVGGPELMSAMEGQARHLGLPIEYGEVGSISRQDQGFMLNLGEGASMLAKAVIIASGANPRKLGVSGEDRLRGKGVSYCATCDGAFFAGKEIAVVGGGDTAITEAIFLARFASKVTVIHRRDQLRATQVLEEEAKANPRISFVLNSEVAEVVGETKVQGLKVKNKQTGQESILPLDGVFVAVGLIPNTDFLKDLVEMTPEGYIVTDERLQTSIPGVYAAGDVRVTPLRQIITAAADGAVCAVEVEHFLAGRQR